MLYRYAQTHTTSVNIRKRRASFCSWNASSKASAAAELLMLGPTLAARKASAPGRGPDAAGAPGGAAAGATTPDCPSAPANMARGL